MNIKKAKIQIKSAMKAYFVKNEIGEYKISIERQRPIFLMGPPGIGKTAIIEQIAQELNVGLVSYSMTHHTRQSALGLPFIEKKNYGGKDYSVSEYTMSEIIATVYDLMENTGIKEGILFLDEINCISETLAPSMLQFLQYKTFGRHQIPPGWVVVTAGNPPEFNNSVREFDIVTWDRLKRIDIEPDYDVWKEYAYSKSIHPAILTYLDIEREDFYKVETTIDGKTFVTARGWSDLSDMIRLYEENGDIVDEDLIKQYLQNHQIAKDFSIYYDLYRKYKSDYQITGILDGTEDNNIIKRAKEAQFDERLALISLILDGITNASEISNIAEESIAELFIDVKKIRDLFSQDEVDFSNILSEQIDYRNRQKQIGKESNSLSSERLFVIGKEVKYLEGIKAVLVEKKPKDATAAFKIIKEEYDILLNELREQISSTDAIFANAFDFFERAFGEGQEILIFVTEITANPHTARYISRNGCKKYYEHNKELLFYERKKEIISEIESLDIEE